MAPSNPTEARQHGVKGVYYGGDWLDIENCNDVFTNPPNCSGCRQNTTAKPCPRSKSRNSKGPNTEYDLVIIGAGCIGSAIARELSKYCLSILWLEAADDVSQGATKGNSGIVHAGYDDKPGTNRAKFCWPGNQMFHQLDRELRFGYQTNGSLVLATNEKELKVLEDLKKRGDTNGVKRLEIWDKETLFKNEPFVNANCVGALFSPDAGNVIPYEFAIALAENAVDNGVELRIRRQVSAISHDQDTGLFTVEAQHWEPEPYIKASTGPKLTLSVVAIALTSLIFGAMGLYMSMDESLDEKTREHSAMATYTSLVAGSLLVYRGLFNSNNAGNASPAPFKKLVEQAGHPEGTGGIKVEVNDMLVGGSGSSKIVNGKVIEVEKIKAKYVVNCAGGGSDQIAKLIGDDSFTIKPRLGDYLLLNRNQGHLAKRTLFPCPDPVLGKGVLVQTTLWGNLILGPTARDMYKPEARDMTAKDIQEYILSKCKQLVPSFDPKETIHAFCGARAKNSRGDWIIEPSAKNANFIHVAGIDSPGLAGSPAIAVEVVKLLQKAGLATPPNSTFNPHRAPIITPKMGMRGLKMGPVGKNDTHDNTDEAKMAANVICKCEKVTELEVVRAMRRSLPIDSTQAIRKRTRAGMGHCQGDPENYNCEARVKAIIARENNVPVSHVGGRPWPATSTLTQRWIDDEEKKELQKRMDKN
mmetsp:Transcript_17299/g.26770  ORF Transcript_17299/g.26770 Transcript_17299/m.26770 type:complete len:698 (-) Transcript_17299:135-2228(-)|eukprot:CAMPEP_0195301466 /NCGR_PEP_ID=MMETSP0707-20130614/29350_1 /TAXON_ID=33640 /ORGANISM="Asterionellopsis glacialis, Strain CCMP134" /LENGTH=697 /DNA_ID=CAMNT_0040364415 /DNA_START=155 /DNA_END=2248 /DNA_ORIENTATION=+